MVRRRPPGLVGAWPALVALLASAPSVHADVGSGRLAPNSIYAEAFGAGLAESLNYERIVVDRFALRAGLGLFGGRAMNGPNGSHHFGFIAVPITVSYVGVRAGPHALELGGGVTVAYSGFGGARLLSVYTTGDYPEPTGVAFAGYRLQPVGRPGLQTRVGAMALAGNGFAWSASDRLNYGGHAGFGVVPWAYMSVGASF